MKRSRRFLAIVSCTVVATAGSACNAARGGSAEAATPEGAREWIPARQMPAPSMRPEIFAFSGKLTQGGWIRGTAPGGTRRLALDGKEIAVEEDGSFFAAFDRDHRENAMLSAVLNDGRSITRELRISPRDWDIEHVNIARRAKGPSDAFMRLRRPELERIKAARSVLADGDGWSQDFIWPVTGRISGRFGSQRIYRGEPGSYHSGIDITTGTSGTPFVAPADGVVVLAANEPFTLEGHLLMIDHGRGLNSAFLHCSAILVSEGEKVKQGQVIGRIGSSGRATGPHLHWGLKWHDARLDPLLFAGPMP